MSLSFKSLKGRDNFGRVMRAGASWRGKYERMACASGVEAQNFVGVIVSKKVSNKATDRNKIRRRIRSIVDNWLKTNEIIGKDIVITANKEAQDADFADLKVEISRGLSKITGGK